MTQEDDRPAVQPGYEPNPAGEFEANEGWTRASEEPVDVPGRGAAAGEHRRTGDAQAAENREFDPPA